MNPPGKKPGWRLLTVIIALGGAGGICFLCSLLFGGVSLSVNEVLGLIHPSLGTALARTKAIVLHIRLPRALLAFTVGAGLSCAGAVLQSLFRNPMASPELLGISAGGGLGAVTAIYSGLAAVSLFILPVSAMIGSLIGAACISMLSRYRGKTSLLFTILAGMAISSFLNALISLVLLFANQYEISQFLFWTMGGFDGRRWEHLVMAGPLVIVLLVWLLSRGNVLNHFLFGEEMAHGTGIAVEREKKQILAAAAMITGLCVSVSGSIGFVGLLVPHFLRFFTSDNRKLLPLSALSGGIFLLACDTVGRSLLPAREIRVGIITALLGAPYFVFVLLRTQRRRMNG